jgi:hypothetical protein
MKFISNGLWIIWFHNAKPNKPFEFFSFHKTYKWVHVL